VSFVRTYPLPVFFVLAYALSWWFVFIDPQSLFPWGPSLAAIIVVALTGGTSRLKALLRRLIIWRVGWIWYVAALGIPIVVTLTSVYLNVLLGAPVPTATDLGRFYTFFVVFPVIFLLGPLGEELGWRGFALPRLQTGRSAFVATLILAVFYAGWHLPLFVSDLGDYAYVPLVIAASFVYTWIFNNTAGSVLLAMLLSTSLAGTASKRSQRNSRALPQLPVWSERVGLRFGFGVGSAATPWPFYCPYSPECVEGEFSEVHIPYREPLSSDCRQPPVELGERRSAHAVDQHRGTDDEATDHPCFLDARLPQGEGRIVERRRPYRTEPSEEEHVFRPPPERS
jgi:uncharacterized protein